MPYNLAMLVVGIAALFLLDVAVSPTLEPGEDSFEPFAVLLFGVAANICYSLGWIVELVARDSIDQTRFGPKMFLRGSIVSLVICAFPGILWTPVMIWRLITK